MKWWWRGWEVGASSYTR